MNDDRISAYLDGTLASDDRAAFERDLAVDPHLAESLTAVAEVRDTLRSLAWHEPPTGFTDRLLAAGATYEEPRVVAPRRVRSWAAVGAAAAAVSLAVFVAEDSDRSPVQPAIEEAGEGHVTNAGLADDPIMLLAPAAGDEQ